MTDRSILNEQNVGILLGGIICDSYYLTFFDSFLIVKLPPDIF